MSSTDTPALNVLGEPLDVCGCQPMTGWYRDGSCRTDGLDLGRHTVCCVVDERFLSYTRAQGNDLSTPMPQFGFPGLKAGDRWCLCAPRWLEAHERKMAPKVFLTRTHKRALEVVPLALLLVPRLLRCYRVSMSRPLPRRGHIRRRCRRRCRD